MNEKKVISKKSNTPILAGGARARRRRRSHAGRAAIMLTVLFALAVGTVLSLTVFFKIKTIDVYGESTYPSDEIISAGKIALDSNLIRLDSKNVAKRICTSLPYIENVSVKKKLPTTAELHVTSAQAAGYIESDGVYAVISTKGKILELAKKKPKKGTQIYGIDVSKLKVSQTVSGYDNALESVETIYSSLGRGITADITELNLGEELDLSFVYNDRVTIKLGSRRDLSQKLKFVVRILLDDNEINPDDIGIIYADNAKKISFLRQGSYKETMQSEASGISDNSSQEQTQEETRTSSSNGTTSESTSSKSVSSKSTSSESTSAKNTSSESASSKIAA